MANDIFVDSSYTVCVKNLTTLRKVRRENQTDFWYRFGVTQSRGSRFEKSNSIPPTVAILIALYLGKKISDADLLAAVHQSNEPMKLESTVSSVLRGND
ncbi:MAG: helix-turn-helix transcriptional regulator [Burkholderiales bacterium]|nr:helix-turn-helix transcriptional regulator [Burkholderiales bacterium]